MHMTGEDQMPVVCQGEIAPFHLSEQQLEGS